MTKVKSKYIQALHLFKTCTGMTHAIVCLFQCTAECEWFSTFTLQFKETNVLQSFATRFNEQAYNTNTYSVTYFLGFIIRNNWNVFWL